MARHVVVLFAALALVAGACSSSEPAASEPSATAVADSTPTPAPTVTPIPEPTATAAPTPTPAPSEEELAVIAAWERYVRSSAEVRSAEPPAESLDFESYMMAAALDGILGVLEEDRVANRYLLGPVGTSVSAVTFRPDGDAVVDACVVSDLVAYAAADDSVVSEEGEIRYAARGRLSFVGSVWLVAASEFVAGECEL